MKVILYTIHCPTCYILEQKLNMKGICFEVVEDVAAIQAKGIDVVPMLEVEGNLMGFADAVKWVNAQPNIDGNN